MQSVSMNETTRSFRETVIYFWSKSFLIIFSDIKIFEKG